MDFSEALKQAYLLNPTQVLPNAYWKTRDRIAGCETIFGCDANGQVNHLEMWQGPRLLAGWDADRDHFNLPVARADTLTFALLHQDTLAGFDTSRFSCQKPYFRLRYDFEGPARLARLPEQYRFANVQIEREAQAVSDLIGQCYDDLHPDVETVRGWAHLPVFAADLWLWVLDEKTGRPAGLGIAEVDPSLPEGSLEWIQVLPEYRSIGLGQALVRELICRMKGRVQFVTVSGESNNLTHPEHLYRSCGFTGEDVWWVMEA